MLTQGFSKGPQSIFHSFCCSWTAGTLSAQQTTQISIRIATFQSPPQPSCDCAGELRRFLLYTYIYTPCWKLSPDRVLQQKLVLNTFSCEHSHPKVTFSPVSAAHLPHGTDHNLSSCIPPGRTLPTTLPGKRENATRTHHNQISLRKSHPWSFSTQLASLEAETCYFSSFKAHCILNKGHQSCKPFHQRHWLFNFTAVPLFHKEYREFISNHTSEGASTCSPLAIV